MPEEFENINEFEDDFLDDDGEDWEVVPSPPTREEYEALQGRLDRLEGALKALLDHLYYSDLSNEPDTAFDEGLKDIIDSLKEDGI